MAEVRHFEFGPIGPMLAAVCAIAGCVLGIILCTKAQKEHGAARFRLLTYACIALGPIAVWQSTVVGLLGLDVSVSVLRLDPALLAIALGGAIVAIGAGLFVVGLGRVAGEGVGVFRLLLGGLLIGAGIVGPHGLVLMSIRTTGQITYDRPILLIAALVGAVASVALLTLVVSTRTLRSAILGGVATGLAICAVHYVGEYALRIEPPVQSVGLTMPAGLTPLYVGIPAMVLGAVTLAMVFFFTVGQATRRDLHVIFSPLESPAEIEDWMIEEVTARVSGTTTVPTTSTAATSLVSARAVVSVNAPPVAGRAPAGRPTPGIVPVWRSLPAPGRPRPGYLNQRSTTTTFHNGHSSPGGFDPSLDQFNTGDLERVVAAARAEPDGPAIERSTVDAGPLPRRQKSEP